MASFRSVNNVLAYFAASVVLTVGWFFLTPEEAPEEPTENSQAQETEGAPKREGMGNLKNFAEKVVKGESKADPQVARELLDPAIYEVLDTIPDEEGRVALSPDPGMAINEPYTAPREWKEMPPLGEHATPPRNFKGAKDVPAEEEKPGKSSPNIETEVASAEGAKSSEAEAVASEGGPSAQTASTDAPKPRRAQMANLREMQEATATNAADQITDTLPDPQETAQDRDPAGTEGPDPRESSRATAKASSGDDPMAEEAPSRQELAKEAVDAPFPEDEVATEELPLSVIQTDTVLTGNALPYKVIAVPGWALISSDSDLTLTISRRVFVDFDVWPDEQSPVSFANNQLALLRQQYPTYSLRRQATTKIDGATWTQFHLQGEGNTIYLFTHAGYRSGYTMKVWADNSALRQANEYVSRLVTSFRFPPDNLFIQPTSEDRNIILDD